MAGVVQVRVVGGELGPVAGVDARLAVGVQGAETVALPGLADDPVVVGQRQPQRVGRLRVRPVLAGAEHDLARLQSVQQAPEHGVVVPEERPLPEQPVFAQRLGLREVVGPVRMKTTSGSASSTSGTRPMPLSSATTCPASSRPVTVVPPMPRLISSHPSARHDDRAKPLLRRRRPGALDTGCPKEHGFCHALLYHVRPEKQDFSGAARNAGQAEPHRVPPRSWLTHAQRRPCRVGDCRRRPVPGLRQPARAQPDQLLPVQREAVGDGADPVRAGQRRAVARRDAGGAARGGAGNSSRMSGMRGRTTVATTRRRARPAGPAVSNGLNRDCAEEPRLSAYLAPGRTVLLFQVARATADVTTRDEGASQGANGLFGGGRRNGGNAAVRARRRSLRHRPPRRRRAGSRPTTFPAGAMPRRPVRPADRETRRVPTAGRRGPRPPATRPRSAVK